MLAKYSIKIRILGKGTINHRQCMGEYDILVMLDKCIEKIMGRGGITEKVGKGRELIEEESSIGGLGN